MVKQQKSRNVNTDIISIGLVLTILGSVLIIVYPLPLLGIVLTEAGAWLIIILNIKRYDEFFVLKEIPKKHRFLRAFVKKEFYFRSEGEKRNRWYWFGTLMLFSVAFILTLIGLVLLYGLKITDIKMLETPLLIIFTVDCLISLISAFAWPSENSRR